MPDCAGGCGCGAERGVAYLDVDKERHGGLRRDVEEEAEAVGRRGNGVEEEQKVKMLKLVISAVTEKRKKGGTAEWGGYGRRLLSPTTISPSFLSLSMIMVYSAKVVGRAGENIGEVNTFLQQSIAQSPHGFSFSFHGRCFPRYFV